MFLNVFIEIIKLTDKVIKKKTTKNTTNHNRDNGNTHIHDRSLFCFGTGTSL